MRRCRWSRRHRWYPFFDPGSTESYSVSGLRLADGLPRPLESYAGDASIFYCPTSWFNHSADWTPDTAAIGYNYWWAKYPSMWTDYFVRTKEDIRSPMEINRSAFFMILPG